MWDSNPASPAVNRRPRNEHVARLKPFPAHADCPSMDATVTALRRHPTRIGRAHGSLLALVALVLVLGISGLALPAQAAVGSNAPGAVTASAPRVAAYEWRRIDVTPLAELRAGFADFKAMGGTTMSLDVSQVVSIAAIRNVSSRTRTLQAWNNALDAYIAAAAASGLRVEALAGDPTWMKPTQRGATVTVMDYVTSFNAPRPPAARLTGLQFDIEPWVDPAWSRSATVLTTQWLDTIASIAAKQAATAPESRVPLTMAVPFWLDGSAAPKALNRGGVVLAPTEHIVRLLDNGTGLGNAIAVMAYRDVVAGPNGSSTLSATEVAFTEKTGGRVGTVIAQEVTNIEPAHITFWQEGRGALVAAMGELTALNAGKTSFGGFAINDFRALTVLP